MKSNLAVNGKNLTAGRHLYLQPFVKVCSVAADNVEMKSVISDINLKILTSVTHTSDTVIKSAENISFVSFFLKDVALERWLFIGEDKIKKKKTGLIIFSASLAQELC